MATQRYRPLTMATPYPSGQMVRVPMTPLETAVGFMMRANHNGSGFIIHDNRSEYMNRISHIVRRAVCSMGTENTYADFDKRADKKARKILDQVVHALQANGYNGSDPLDWLTALWMDGWIAGQADAIDNPPPLDGPDEE